MGSISGMIYTQSSSSQYPQVQAIQFWPLYSATSYAKWVKQTQPTLVPIAVSSGALLTLASFLIGSPPLWDSFQPSSQSLLFKVFVSTEAFRNFLFDCLVYFWACFPSSSAAFIAVIQSSASCIAFSSSFFSLRFLVLFLFSFFSMLLFLKKA